MRNIWPLMQALPLVIVFVAIVGFGLTVVELWLTRAAIVGAGYGYDGPDPAERMIFMSSFMRAVVDFVWNLGWAAVVLAAVRYCEKTVERV